MTLTEMMNKKVTITSELLESEIKNYSQKYYEGNEEISDEEFDELVDLLREMNPESDVLTAIGWGFNPNSVPGSKAHHKYQTMGSLAKAREISQIDNSIIGIGNEYIVSAKLDGLSCVAYYKNGNLVRAITRGNGEVGIDITDKFSEISVTSVDSFFTGAVRGELIIKNSDWNIIKSINENARSQRNYAAGIINRNDISNDLYLVSFVPYNVVGIESSGFYEFSDVLSWISGNFNCVVPHSSVLYGAPSIDNLHDMYSSYKEEYPVDGLVVTNNNVVIDEYTRAVKYNQMAFKFQSERKYSKVTGIRWNLTRTNRLVPTVNIEPIELDEAIVSNVTGFNAKYIEDNKIGEGAIIEVERSGLVIPDIQSVVSPKPDDVENIPTVCPVCGHSLEWSGVDLVCNNPDCGNREYRDLQCWVNTLGVIDRLGNDLKFKFMDELGYESIDDLYSKDLVVDSWARGTQKSLFKSMMDKLRNQNVDTTDALCALNIPRLGRTSASKLSENTEILEVLMSYAIDGVQTDEYALQTDLSKLVGQATALSIMNNLNKVCNLKYVRDRLTKSSTVMKDGIKVAITGKLSVKRSDFEKLLNDYGYQVSGINKDTKFLITDNPNSGSSKNRAADALGVEKITEADFREKFLGR